MKQLIVYLAGNIAFLLAYSFCISWIIYGLLVHTRRIRNVNCEQIGQYVEAVPWIIKLWLTMQGDEKYEQDPIMTISTNSTPTEQWRHLSVGIVTLILIIFASLVMFIYSVKTRNLILLLNLLALTTSTILYSLFQVAAIRKMSG